MELYKLVILFMMLNLSISSISYMTEENTTWDEWMLSAPGTDSITGARTFVTSQLNNSLVAEAEGKNEYTGGMSIPMLVGIVYNVITKTCVEGIAITMHAISNNQSTGIFGMINYIILIFFGVLLFFIGMKTYTWVKNRDST